MDSARSSVGDGGKRQRKPAPAYRGRTDVEHGLDGEFEVDALVLYFAGSRVQTLLAQYRPMVR